jgi:hypothetical protein
MEMVDGDQDHVESIVPAFGDAHGVILGHVRLAAEQKTAAFALGKGQGFGNVGKILFFIEIDEFPAHPFIPIVVGKANLPQTQIFGDAQDVFCVLVGVIGAKRKLRVDMVIVIQLKTHIILLSK